MNTLNTNSWTQTSIVKILKFHWQIFFINLLDSYLLCKRIYKKHFKLLHSLQSMLGPIMTSIFHFPYSVLHCLEYGVENGYAPGVKSIKFLKLGCDDCNITWEWVLECVLDSYLRVTFMQVWWHTTSFKCSMTDV